MTQSESKKTNLQCIRQTNHINASVVTNFETNISDGSYYGHIGSSSGTIDTLKYLICVENSLYENLYFNIWIKKNF